MSQGSIRVHKQLNADTLFRQIHSAFEILLDLNAAEVKIPLADALISGFAVLSLKDHSLLAFDQRRQDETKLKNPLPLYHIDEMPCDTQLLVILDEVETEELCIRRDLERPNVGKCWNRSSFWMAAICCRLMALNIFHPPQFIVLKFCLLRD